MMFTDLEPALEWLMRQRLPEAPQRP
jgi:hypothetical protein